MIKRKKLIAILTVVALLNSIGYTTYASEITNKAENVKALAGINEKASKEKVNEFKAGEVIVKFKDNLNQKSVGNVKSLVKDSVNLEVKDIETISSTLSLNILKFSQDVPVENVINLLNQKMGEYIEYAEPNYKLSINSTDLEPKDASINLDSIEDYVQKDQEALNNQQNNISPKWLPNDPQFSNLWGLKNTGQSIGGVSGKAGIDIKAEKAWDVTRGSSSVVVGVIDTGIEYTHDDLKANMYVNTKEIAKNGKDDDGNGYIDDVSGWDFANDDNDPIDDNSHGTHCAGTIAAANNGKGVVGVAPNIKLMPLKFLDEGGSGYTSDAVKAVEYATKMNVPVLSNSYGGAGYSKSFYDAIEKYQGVFIAAAGNDWENNDTYPHYPSSYSNSNIISVASIANDGELSWFSNYGKKSVDVGAPGSDVYSTVLRNSYGYKSGTSMAAPHVAGVAALVKSVNPSFNKSQVAAKLLSSVTKIASLDGNVATGGLIDASKAVEAPQGNDNEIPGVPLTGTVVKGALEANVDIHDVHKVYFKKGEMISISLTADAGTDFNLVLYNPRAKTVNSMANAIKYSYRAKTSNEYINLQIPEDGYYYIDVRGSVGKGNYTLTTNRYNGLKPGWHQDNSSFLLYNSKWTTYKNSAASGGTYTAINSPGSMEFSFNGTAVGISAYKNNWQGVAKITVDGKVYYADMYSATNKFQQTVFWIGNLPQGNHKVKVEWTGQKSKYSNGQGGTYINIDGISIK